MIKNERILYKDSIHQICQQLEGKVYETEMDFELVEPFRKEYFSLSERQENGRMKIRFIAEKQFDDGWKKATPTLEDVFLYQYQDEGAE